MFFFADIQTDFLYSHYSPENRHRITVCRLNALYFSKMFARMKREFPDLIRIVLEGMCCLTNEPSEYKRTAELMRDHQEFRLQLEELLPMLHKKDAAIFRRTISEIQIPSAVFRSVPFQKENR